LAKGTKGGVYAREATTNARKKEERKESEKRKKKKVMKKITRTPVPMLEGLEEMAKQFEHLYTELKQVHEHLKLFKSSQMLGIFFIFFFFPLRCNLNPLTCNFSHSAPLG
jgi:hypothetical protein